MQFTRKMEGQFSISTETDKVIAWVAIPPGGKVEQVWFDVATSAGHIDVNDAVLYGVTGMCTRVPDADTVDEIDDTWDRMVPKDKISTQEIDTDTLTEITAAEFEPGHVELEPSVWMPSVIRSSSGVGDAYATHSPRSASSMVHPYLYTPIDYFKTKARLMIPVKASSVAMIGFSSPGMGVTTIGVADTPTDHEWQMLTWLEVFLFDHWKQITGLIETGAETPYVDATNFITALLEPLVQENTAGSYFATTFIVWCSATWQVSVPGSPGEFSLTGG